MIEEPIRAAETHAFIPLTTQRVMSRLAVVAQAIGDPHQRAGEGVFKNSFVLSTAGVILAGTNCRAPLLERECSEIGELIGFDVVLMRFDADCGAQFDIYLSPPNQILRGYVAWHSAEDGLWFLPDTNDGASVSVTADGIKLQSRPPSTRGSDRVAGTSRMIHSARLSEGN